MLAIGVRYLMGWSMAAADGAAKQRHEWPPHPDRLFMALTSACFEAECGDAAEAALNWLENQPSPELAFSQASYRRIVTSYVPVNDAKSPKLKEGKEPSEGQIKNGLSLLPESRLRQPRQFPLAIPESPNIHFIWPGVALNGHREGLEMLCRSVTSLGHSSSLVQAWLCDDPPPANLAPTDAISECRLRVPGPGRLSHLIRRYNEAAIHEHSSLVQELRLAKGKLKKQVKETIRERFPNGEPRWLRPDPARHQGYRRVADIGNAPEIPSSLFDERLLVLRRTSGRPLGLESTLLLTEAARKTILSRCEDPIPEWVSGHTKDGKASKVPHMAVFPLPHVGCEHADGHFLGLAIAMPRSVPENEIARNLAWLNDYDKSGQPRPIAIYNGKHIDWQVCLEQSEFPPRALRMETWAKHSQYWATVTPIVFDRYPKGAEKERQVLKMIATACERIGLPKPASVMLTEVSPFPGVPHRSRFPALLRKHDQARMRHSHAVLCFDAPVSGPVLLGAGRFRGYGLCRPLLPAGRSDQ